MRTHRSGRNRTSAPDKQWRDAQVSHRQGEEESVGVFLRNLDMRRGRRISAGYARRRHVCETIHRAMKRWMNFDVRGLRKESDEQRKSFKFFTAQILCTIFDPYYQPERFH